MNIEDMDDISRQQLRAFYRNRGKPAKRQKKRPANIEPWQHCDYWGANPLAEAPLMIAALLGAAKLKRIPKRAR